MSRRPTYERIDAAREAATRNRLIGEGMSASRVGAALAAWAEQAAREGIPRESACWDAAYPLALARRR